MSIHKEVIWQVVAQIPTGRVATYGQIADLAGLGRGARLVGRILSQLPKDTKLPWFRVINARGEISFPVDHAGYIRQRNLLEEEGISFINGRIKLANYQWKP